MRLNQSLNILVFSQIGSLVKHFSLCDVSVDSNPSKLARQRVTDIFNSKIDILKWSVDMKSSRNGKLQVLITYFLTSKYCSCFFPFNNCVIFINLSIASRLSMMEIVVARKIQPNKSLLLSITFKYIFGRLKVSMGNG